MPDPKPKPYLIISGPKGIGKSSLIRGLIAVNPVVHFYEEIQTKADVPEGEKSPAPGNGTITIVDAHERAVFMPVSCGRFKPANGVAELWERRAQQVLDALAQERRNDV